MRRLFFLLGVLAASACNNGGDNDQYEYQPGIQGTWLLTERGYSPGSGYIVEPVPSSPAQTLTFGGPKTFKSNMQGFLDFKFYEIVVDNSEASLLNLYVDDPELVKQDVSFKNSFRIVLGDNDLQIMQLGCIEGCHLGFEKIALLPD
jgi:hypothetical protein